MEVVVVFMTVPDGNPARPRFAGGRYPIRDGAGITLRFIPAYAKTADRWERPHPKPRRVRQGSVTAGLTISL